MKKRTILLIAFFAFLVFIFANVFAAESGTNAKIDSAIYERLEQQGKVKVFINLKEPATVFLGKTASLEKTERMEAIKSEIISDFSKMPIEKFKLRHEFDDSFSAEISFEALEQLKNDPRVENIEEVAIVHAFLSDSVPLINATLAWPLKVNGTNLTGEGETVCVIDTGVNYSHSALGGCFGNNTDFSCKVIAGYDYVNNDANPMDDQYHGTYVAGIIAANGSVVGVAPGARIVAIKVLGSDGNGLTDNLIKGIDWCVNNASIFNISVISMSLGCSNFSGYCDSDTSCSSSQIAVRINNAIARNITVIAATGNDAMKTNISSPACIRNSTAVGATTKTDVFWSSSDRNNITDLVAPGASITSCYIDGTTATASGTSAAAPHVSGAVALLQQFKKLEKERNLTVQEIQNALNLTGKQITDTGLSNLTYSRINIYAALLAIEETKPNLTLSHPQNTTYSSNISIAINFSASDNLNLSDCLYSIDSSANVTLQNCHNSTFNTTQGTHTFVLSAIDSAGNINSSSVVFNLDAFPIVSLIAPSNNTLNSTNETQTFSCNASDDIQLANITLYIWNASAQVHANTSNVSGLYNQTNFSYALPYEGSFKWYCNANDNLSNSVSSGNYTITFFDYNISACRNIITAGSYIFNKSVENSASLACINISVSDVEIDCNGYITDGSSSDSSYGILAYGTAASGITNITARNCTITDWDYGISFVYGENSTFLNNNVSYSVSGGISLNYSAANFLGNNTIAFVNSPATGPYYAAQSIFLIDSNSTIIKNNNLSHGKNATGINIYNSHINSITNNNITNHSVHCGILVRTNSRDNLISNNWLYNNSFGICFSSAGSNNSVINTTATASSDYDSNITDTSILISNNFSGSYYFNNLTLSIENSSNAKINFPNITQNGTNFSADIVVRNNYVFVNSSQTGLNKSANLSFYGLNFNNPRLLRNGLPCENLNSNLSLNKTCARISYSSGNGTLVFNVTGFSAYSAEDYCGNGHCESGESCSSCSADCGSCPVTTSAGGGGGGGVIAKTYVEGNLKEGKIVNRVLGKNDKIKFVLRNNEHNLTAKNVGINNATFELNSSSLTFMMLIGESRKFNLTDNMFYDLLVKLNNVTSAGANLTLTALFEMIPPARIEEEQENVTNVTQVVVQEETEGEKPSLGKLNSKEIIILSVTAILVIVLLYSIVIFKIYKKFKNKKV